MFGVHLSGLYVFEWTHFQDSYFLGHTQNACAWWMHTDVIQAHDENVKFEIFTW